MSFPCTVCAHAKVEEINRLILSHTPLREIVSRVPGTTRSALGRHRKHVGGLLVRAVARIAAPRVEAAEVERFEDSLLSKVARLEADARRIAARAEDEGDLRAALVANSSLLNVVKLLHELLPASETTPAVEVRFIFPDSGAESRSAEIARETGQRGAVAGSTTDGAASSIPEVDEVSQPDVEPEAHRVEEIVAAPEKAPVPGPFAFSPPRAPGGRTR